MAKNLNELEKLKQEIQKQKAKQQQNIEIVNVAKPPLIVPRFKAHLNERKHEESETRAFLSDMLRKKYKKYLSSASKLYMRENEDLEAVERWEEETEEEKRRYIYKVFGMDPEGMKTRSFFMDKLNGLTIELQDNFIENYLQQNATYQVYYHTWSTSENIKNDIAQVYQNEDAKLTQNFTRMSVIIDDIYNNAINFSNEHKLDIPYLKKESEKDSLDNRIYYQEFVRAILRSNNKSEKISYEDYKEVYFEDQKAFLAENMENLSMRKFKRKFEEEYANMFNVYDQIYKNYEQEYLQNEGKYTSDDFKKLHKIFAKVYIRYAKSLNRILVNHHKPKVNFSHLPIEKLAQYIQNTEKILLRDSDPKYIVSLRNFSVKKLRKAADALEIKYQENTDNNNILYLILAKNLVLKGNQKVDLEELKAQALKAKLEVSDLDDIITLTNKLDNLKLDKDKHSKSQKLYLSGTTADRNKIREKIKTNNPRLSTDEINALVSEEANAIELMPKEKYDLIQYITSITNTSFKKYNNLNIDELSVIADDLKMEGKNNNIQKNPNFFGRKTMALDKKQLGKIRCIDEYKKFDWLPTKINNIWISSDNIGDIAEFIFPEEKINVTILDTLSFYKPNFNFYMLQCSDKRKEQNGIIFTCYDKEDNPINFYIAYEFDLNNSSKLEEDADFVFNIEENNLHNVVIQSESLYNRKLQYDEIKRQQDVKNIENLLDKPINEDAKLVAAKYLQYQLLSQSPNNKYYQDFTKKSYTWSVTENLVKESANISDLYRNLAEIAVYLKIDKTVIFQNRVASMYYSAEIFSVLTPDDKFPELYLLNEQSEIDAIISIIREDVEIVKNEIGVIYEELKRNKVFNLADSKINPVINLQGQTAESTCENYQDLNKINLKDRIFYSDTNGKRYCFSIFDILQSKDGINPHNGKKMQKRFIKDVKDKFNLEFIKFGLTEQDIPSTQEKISNNTGLWELVIQSVIRLNKSEVVENVKDENDDNDDESNDDTTDDDGKENTVEEKEEVDSDEEKEDVSIHKCDYCKKQIKLRLFKSVKIVKNKPKIVYFCCVDCFSFFKF